MAARPPTTDWATARQTRRDKPFPFQPIQRRVYRTSRHIAPQSMLHFLQDGSAVAFAAERRAWLHEREQYRLFKHTDVL